MRSGVWQPDSEAVRSVLAGCAYALLALLLAAWWAAFVIIVIELV